MHQMDCLCSEGSLIAEALTREMYEHFYVNFRLWIYAAHEVQSAFFVSLLSEIDNKPQVITRANRFLEPALRR